MIKIGAVYQHFKGGLYRVSGVAKDSETALESVIYVSLKTGEAWHRPLDMWSASVTTQEGVRPRFELVSDS